MDDLISVIVHYRLKRGKGKKENYFFTHLVSRSDLEKEGCLINFSQKVEEEIKFFTFSEFGLSTEVKKVKIKSFQVLNF
jgi:hypothetical protein